jgi:hypothetical protein
MRTLAECWDVVAEIMFENSSDLYADEMSIEECIAKAELTDSERDLVLDDHKRSEEWDEPVDPNAEDLKSYIPGVGFLVTNLGTGESHIFED